MRETNFIEQNKGKWVKFEQVLKDNKKDPEELSNLFIEITDDLSYSRTFYPNRSVRVYLNNLAQRVFYDIYRNRKSRLKRFWQFWKDDVPQILFESRFDLLLAFVIFALSMGIGIFSTIMDPDFPRVILGNDYVEMTLKNIKEGNPMAVYQDSEQTGMFLQITWNNLRVAFMTFILGLFFGGGTIYFVLYNGIMVGAFQYFFFQQGVYWDSLLTIWLHGAIEISCIVIAGAAGIHLGRGLLFPGTFTRLQGLQLSARRALLIYLTITPLIILAAFIESFITRYSDAPYIIRIILIAFSFVFMFGYYIWYPWRKAQRGFTANLREVNLPPMRQVSIEFHKIKNSGQIFTDAFTFYRIHIKSLATLAAVLAFALTAVLILTEKELYFRQANTFFFFFESLAATMNNSMQFLFLPSISLHWMLNVLGVAIMAFYTLYRLARMANPAKVSTGYILQTAVSALVISGFLNGLMIVSNGGYGVMVFLYMAFLFPVFILWLSTIFNEGGNLLSGLGKTLRLLGGNWPTMMGAYIVMVLMCFVFLFLTTAPLLDFFSEIVISILPFGESDAELFYKAFHIFIMSYMLCFLFPLVFATMSIAQYSFQETQDAKDLIEQIPQIGIRKRSYGMEREEISKSNTLA